MSSGGLLPQLALPGVGDHLVVVLAGELVDAGHWSPSFPWLKN
jgi:hypothetical protein